MPRISRNVLRAVAVIALPVALSACASSSDVDKLRADMNAMHADLSAQIQKAQATADAAQQSANAANTAAQQSAQQSAAIYKQSLKK